MQTQNSENKYLNPFKGKIQIMHTSFENGRGSNKRNVWMVTTENCSNKLKFTEAVNGYGRYVT